LLSDALTFAISMSLKFRDEIDSTTFDNLMEKDGNVVYELSCLPSNVTRSCLGFEFFFSFIQKYEKIKAHNIYF